MRSTLLKTRRFVPSPRKSRALRGRSRPVARLIGEYIRPEGGVQRVDFSLYRGPQGRFIEVDDEDNVLDLSGGGDGAAFGRSLPGGMLSAARVRGLLKKTPFVHMGRNPGAFQIHFLSSLIKAPRLAGVSQNEPLWISIASSGSSATVAAHSGRSGRLLLFAPVPVAIFPPASLPPLAIGLGLYFKMLGLFPMGLALGAAVAAFDTACAVGTAAEISLAAGIAANPGLAIAILILLILLLLLALWILQETTPAAFAPGGAAPAPGLGPKLKTLEKKLNDLKKGLEDARDNNKPPSEKQIKDVGDALKDARDVTKEAADAGVIDPDQKGDIDKALNNAADAGKSVGVGK